MDYVTDRNAYYDKYFSSNDVLTVFTNKLKPGKRLLITGPETTWVFPFLIRRPEFRVTVARPNHIQLGDKTYDIYIEEDYNDLKSMFDDTDPMTWIFLKLDAR